MRGSVGTLDCTAEGGCGVLSESCGRRVGVMAAGSYVWKMHRSIVTWSILTYLCIVSGTILLHARTLGGGTVTL